MKVIVNWEKLAGHSSIACALSLLAICATWELRSFWVTFILALTAMLTSIVVIWCICELQDKY